MNIRLRYLVLTGAVSGKRMILEIGTIEQVLEAGIAYSADGDIDNCVPTEHTEVITHRGRYSVLEDFDTIKNAMSGN